MKTIFLALLLSASFALADASISFQQLQAGDSITVMFTSSGCFNFESYELKFQRAATVTAKVTQVDFDWNEEKARNEETKRTPRGTVTLSEAELAGIDRLFAFYRSKKPGGCTTVDQITATYERGGVIRTTESFTDATCATYEMKGLTRLPAIVAKLESEAK